jgi:branched-chain amino acid transport system ATP-binding protein
MATLEIDHVTVRFGGLVALREVAFEVAEGEFVSVIGPNGAGKTTLFNTIAGVVKPSAGRIRLAGREVQGSKPARMSHLGVRRTFQVARPFAGLTVRENVRVAAAEKPILHSIRSFGLSRRGHTVTQWVDELLALVDLTEMADTKADQLNMGSLRRLEIARALAGRPSILLLDEPAAGIGADGLGPLTDLIRGVHRRGLSVLLVEHYVGLALALSDRVAVLDEGRLIALGTPDVVRHDEQVIAAYLGRQAEGQPQVSEGQPSVSEGQPPVSEGSQP